MNPQGAVLVTVAGGPGCLNAWMDFSDGSTVGGDGDFGDTYLTISEKIINNVLLSAPTTDMVFNVPAGLLGATTRSYYLRFRLSPTDPNGACTAAIAPTDFVEGGEVEDYLIPFSPLAVDLAFFTADATEAGVTLAWETVSETGQRRLQRLSCGLRRGAVGAAQRRAHPGRCAGFIRKGTHTPGPTPA